MTMYGKGGSGGSRSAGGTASRGGLLSRAASAIRRGVGRLFGRR